MVAAGKRERAHLGDKGFVCAQRAFDNTQANTRPQVGRDDKAKIEAATLADDVLG